MKEKRILRGLSAWLILIMALSCMSAFSEPDARYAPDIAHYNPVYNDDVFYNDKNDASAYIANAMWHMFGAIDDGRNLVYRFGNEPTWFEWMAEKIMWSGDKAYISELKGKIRSFPQTQTGYMWSWGAYPFWKVDNCYSIHYDGTFRYICAVYDVIAWEGNTDFLFECDSDTASGAYAHMDASNGKTVLKKTEACMDYILKYLNGENGIILLTEESTYLTKDGKERFDYVIESDMYCWNNTGRDNSAASNYWDNLCFGHYDAYSGALFYNALSSMMGIYRFLGGEYAEKADALETLKEEVRQKFNDMYWSEEKGRYIACVDADGRKVDFGLTFLNYEIMKYGLADEDKAEKIFAWVDGDRIIEGEDRTGEDIFSYAKIWERTYKPETARIKELGLRLASVTNTIAINNRENRKAKTAWWHAPNGINVWGSASYGSHLENGGYIFYPVFYELMARAGYEGAQAVYERLLEIARVYEFNGLVSDVSALGSAAWLEGLIGEFPESGLVPTVYLYGLMGISAEYDGLHIAPMFIDGHEYMGVKKMTYAGNDYEIQLHKNGRAEIIPKNVKIDLKLFYTPYSHSDASFCITVKTADGEEVMKIDPDENGWISLDLHFESAVSITIAPETK